MARDVKVVTDISKNGDVIVVQRIRPKKTTTNHLTIGKECEIDTIKGDKAKVKRVVFRKSSKEYYVLTNLETILKLSFNDQNKI